MNELIEQIKRAAHADERDRPMASTGRDVPWSAEALTVEWLDDVIGRGAGGRRVTSFDLGSGSSGTSVRRRLNIGFEGDGAAVPMFAKTCPAFEHRVANVLTETAQAEGRFYLELRPELKIEAPIGYHWAADSKTFRSIILIEDLVATKGATFCDWRTSISRREAENLVTLLAQFHAHFYDDARLADRAPWLKTFPEWAAALRDLKPQHLQAMEEAQDVIPASLRSKGAEIFLAFLRLLDVSDSAPRTLLHSDVHLGNWYKTADGRMGLCDWQCCNRGHWARDFAYAVTTSLAIDDRRNWERGLLAIYLSEMARITGRAFDADDAFLAYRRHVPAALMMWTPTLCPAPDFPAMQPAEMSRLMIARTTAAMEDLESLDSLS